MKPIIGITMGVRFRTFSCETPAREAAQGLFNGIGLFGREGIALELLWFLPQLRTGI